LGIEFFIINPNPPAKKRDRLLKRGYNCNVEKFSLLPIFIGIKEGRGG
jgi:hypothetical protein